MDSKTNLHFKLTQNKILSRTIVYCHDLPGLVAFRKLIENKTENEEMLNVIGWDEGKSVLKIVWNWSLCSHKDNGGTKTKGPKKSIVLAAVSGVRETNHNMSVLFKLTKLNEIEYKLSEDLKLINITVGIGTYSSKFPCPYGQCEKD